MVTYNAMNVALPNLDQQATTQWLAQVAQGYGRRLGDINYIFVDDEEILRLNREFVGHDYYTDHIGFDYCEADILAGDIFISLDTIRTNAELFHATYQHELYRVIAHGLLHLCGIEDKTPADRMVMEEAENKALSQTALHTEWI
ncbi:MAG: rRNA maturation RNase YbeY [Bacteroidales bacterium]|nr:rRNA maturation RNase YbeY [Candidatus Physcousia equi]